MRPASLDVLMRLNYTYFARHFREQYQRRKRQTAFSLSLKAIKNFISQTSLRIEIRVALPGSRASWAKSIVRQDTIVTTNCRDNEWNGAGHKTPSLRCPIEGGIMAFGYVIYTFDKCMMERYYTDAWLYTIHTLKLCNIYYIISNFIYMIYNF